MKRVQKLLKKIPSYSYKMCYNETGEVYNPDGSTYDIFNNIYGLINILAQIAGDSGTRPFAEGDDYWVLDDDGDGGWQAVLSCWDDQSEELWTPENSHLFFRNLEDLLKDVVESGEDVIMVCDHRLNAPYEISFNKGQYTPDKYKRVFQISFDIAETHHETEQDRSNLCYSINELINNFCDVNGQELLFHCVNADFPITDMSHAYGANELKDLND